MNRIKKLMVATVFGLVLMGVTATPVSAKAKKASKPIDISKYVVQGNSSFELKKNKKIKIKKIIKNDLFRKKNKKRYYIIESVKNEKKYKLKTKIIGFNGTRTVKGFYCDYYPNYGKTKYYYTFTYKGKKYCFKKTSNYKNKIKTPKATISFYDQNKESIKSWMSRYVDLTENAYNFTTSKFSVQVYQDDHIDYDGNYIIDCKVNFNLNNPNLIDYNTFKISDKHSEYHDYFEKNNIHSNSDLYNFVKNKISGLDNIVVSSSFKVNNSRTPYTVFNGDISKTHPALYAEINKRFDGDMFWRLINPTYSFSYKLEGKNKTVTLGSARYTLNRTSIFTFGDNINVGGITKEHIKEENLELGLQRYTNNRHDVGEKGWSWELVSGNLSTKYICDLK